MAHFQLGVFERLLKILVKTFPPKKQRKMQLFILSLLSICMTYVHCTGEQIPINSNIKT